MRCSGGSEPGVMDKPGRKRQGLDERASFQELKKM